MSSGGPLHPDQGDNPGVFTGLLIPSSAPNPKAKQRGSVKHTKPVSEHSFWRLLLQSCLKN